MRLKRNVRRYRERLADGLRLLHSDRDFDPFEEHLGLQVVSCRV